MNKLTSIRIKQNDGTYSDDIPIQVLAENVSWILGSSISLLDILGDVKYTTKGSIQHQLDTFTLDEVENARVGADDTQYQNLKARLDGEYEDLQDAIAAVAANLQTETGTRSNEDTAIRASISAQATTRQNNDNAIIASVTDQARTRQNNDTTLSNQITTEVNARKNGDTALTNLISAEESARINAINTEAATRQAAITTVQTNMTALANISDEFRGKHLLIVGDSWTAGYNGSGSTVGWTPTFINLLGCTADVDYESGAGFARASQQNGALHPGETLVNVLDHYQDNDYYAIIVQCGVNDINYSSSVENLASGIASFAEKCHTYWTNAKIIFFPTYAKHYIAINRQQYATTLINNAINAGMDVCRNCLNWALFGSDTMKGNDNSHLSLDGYVQLGKWAAAYCNGWNGEYINNDLTYQSDGQKQSYAFNVAWETAGNVHPTYNKNVYVRANGDTVGIISSFVVNTSTTSGNIAIITGLPLEKTSGGIFLEARVTDLSVIAPRAYVHNGTLYLEILGNQNLNMVRVHISGHYHSKQNGF